MLHEEIGESGLIRARNAAERVLEVQEVVTQNEIDLGRLAANDLRVPEALEMLRRSRKNLASASVLYHKELYMWDQAQGRST